MVVTFVRVELTNPADISRGETVRLFVDSGTIHSVVPEGMMQRLGIAPASTEAFHLVDGSTVVRKRGIAGIRMGGRTGVANVIFGEEGDAALLGATTLSSLGFKLDPLRRELRPPVMTL